ncbi:uncharacterized protein si:cabz01007802.1 isoform X3 [Kryptolebias marmoratus]|uniref:uncharacterized protein si:cabz01007802.1 isoform X3 n=1 Tax=Kryptolebias marmoratus TaxID=37003 RepID=UPI0018ACD29F|nr:uncharacterized protein si:cabz01007802.1 isoform X3 [Kryptolebias marmoratus]
MNMFRRDKGSTAPVVPPRPTQEELDNPIPHSLNRQDSGATSASQNNSELTDEPNPKSKPKSGVMGVVQKVNPFKSASKASSAVTKAPSSESLEQPTESTQNPGMLKGVMQKVNPFKSASQVSKAPSSESLEQERGSDSSTQNPGKLKGVIQKVNPFKSSAQLPKNPEDDSPNSQEPDRELEDKQNLGMMRGMIQKVNPFKSSQPKETQPPHSDLSSSSGSLVDNNVPAKQNPGMFKGMMQKVNPFRSNTQVAEGACETDSVAVVPSNSTQDDRAVHSEHSSSSESLDDSEIERHTIWYADADTSFEVKNEPPEATSKRTKTFVLKKILPSAFFGSGSKSSASSETQAQAQETLQVQTLQLAEIPVPGEEAQLDPLEDEEGLLAWWKTVEGWDEWNQTKQDDEAEEVVEEAADRVFMAARLFVRFFNQRGASLQQRILELLALADSADNFHKKTVTASMGGGVASVAGSVTTITGLILAPFTAGTSLIVTAVGIGIATAGGVTSASANITDTVHSKTDRKKVEKMIQDYQEEIKDIKECLEFLQEGMETLEDWNFEKYAESISKKHLNQNVKHVMKEGGRAGKALVINTESLISTVQVLGVAGGAAKAAQVMSVTTGVMSGLFLALDVFFLAKDSMELKKGAKTDFAAKIREVCKDLQDGLLELNRIKEELQKTMDGIEVEIEEEEDEEMLKADLKKPAEFEEGKWSRD